MAPSPSPSSSPASPSTYAFQAPASLLPLLHAARYPSSTVLGCLLTSSGSSSNSDTVEFVHAIPLLHHWTALSFAIELGLTLVEEYAAYKGYALAGLYFANEGIGSGTCAVPELLKKVVKAAAADPAKPRLSVFALDNKHLTSDTKAFTPVDPATSTAIPGATITFPTVGIKTTFVPQPIQTPASPSVLPRLIKARQHENLEDWDQHLEDIGARWLANENVQLVQPGEELPLQPQPQTLLEKATASKEAAARIASDEDASKGEEAPTVNAGR